MRWNTFKTKYIRSTSTIANFEHNQYNRLMFLLSILNKEMQDDSLYTHITTHLFGECDSVEINSVSSLIEEHCWHHIASKRRVSAAEELKTSLHLQL